MSRYCFISATSSDTSHDRVRRIRRDRLQLLQDVARIVRRMFRIEQQPVEAGEASTRRRTRPQDRPRARSETAFLEGLLEGIHGKLHRRSLDQTNGSDTAQRAVVGVRSTSPRLALVGRVNEPPARNRRHSSCSP